MTFSNLEPNKNHHCGKMTPSDLSFLLTTASGPSRELDRAISETLDVRLRDYSSSVDACLKLIHEKLPTAHWHIGRDTDGVSMYATLANGRYRVESTRVTVPLALLSVVTEYLGSHS